MPKGIHFYLSLGGRVGLLRFLFPLWFSVFSTFSTLRMYFFYNQKKLRLIYKVSLFTLYSGSGGC